MGLFSNDDVQHKRKAQKYRELIRKEAVLGGKLFGSLPAGHRREFFCLDERTWVWHEEWIDKENRRHVQTTRYDVRPSGVVKCQNNGPYTKVSPSEANNLLDAANRYKSIVLSELYSGAK